MSGSALLRTSGWIGVAVLLVLAATWSSFFGRPTEPPDPTADEISQFARLPENKQATALSQLASRAAKNGTICQVLVVQAVPNAPPVVVKNIEDTDGDEEPAHWPAPWPSVVSALQQPLAGPLTVAGAYTGINYQHRLIPLDKTGTRCLLINSAAKPPGWLGVRGGLIFAALLLAIWLARWE